MSCPLPELKYTIKAYVEIEKLFGTSIFNSAEIFKESITLEDIVKLMYCGIKFKQKNLTLERTYEILENILKEHSLTELLQHIAKKYNEDLTSYLAPYEEGENTEKN